MSPRYQICVFPHYAEWKVHEAGAEVHVNTDVFVSVTISEDTNFTLKTFPSGSEGFSSLTEKDLQIKEKQKRTETNWVNSQLIGTSKPIIVSTIASHVQQRQI